MSAKQYDGVDVTDVTSWLSWSVSSGLTIPDATMRTMLHSSHEHRLTQNTTNDAACFQQIDY